MYIDCFISPDRLDCEYVHDNIGRVRAAAACAINAGARIVSLGGFSSILIEGNFDQLPEKADTVFTTGNTLTVAFIVQGIRKMCAMEGREISKIDAPHRWSNRRCGLWLCPLPGTFRQTHRALRAQRGAASVRLPPSCKLRDRGRNRNQSRTSPVCGQHRDLRGEPGFPFTSLGPHCPRGHHLRCGLPEKPESRAES